MNFKLIQQALVALEMYRECTPEGNGVAEQAIVALKQFKKEWQETEVPYVVVECNCSGKTTLFSPPQQSAIARTAAVGEDTRRAWVGLTDEEKAEIQSLKWWDWEDTFDLDGYTRAVETKLKEKNA